MVKNRLIAFVGIVIMYSFTNIDAQEKGYGDWLDGFTTYPSMRERRVLVLVNACRTAPESYRDAYIGSYSILLPQTYPAVDPLYWHLDLNRSARIHCIDMANNHGLSHSSSDGTSWDARIKSYYTKSGNLGENIASGSSDAFGTMKQWITDGNPPAADNSGSDGHRANIMNSRYKEMGNGYAYGPIRYNYFWTQDFSGGASTYTTPISAAAHFVLSNATQFMAIYKDPTGLAPVKAEVIIDSTPHTLTLLIGTAQRGTYSVSLAKASDCRYYYFQFVTGDNATWRHPQAGMLITQGEGSCDKEYLDPDSANGIAWSPHTIKETLHYVYTRAGGRGVLIVTLAGEEFAPQTLRICNSKGRFVLQQPWHDDGAVNGLRQCVATLTLPPGICFLHVQTHDDRTVICKLIVTR